MNGDSRLYQALDELGIQYDYYEHPPVPTIELARIYWKDIEATHCKNLFFRNHCSPFIAHHSLFIEHCSLPIRSFIGILQPFVDLRFAGLINRYIFAASNYQLPVKTISHGTTRK